jgi:DNA ligase (NAD+)
MKKEIPEVVKKLGFKTEEHFIDFFVNADNKYYEEGAETFEINGIKISDAVYDTVKDYFLEKFPNNSIQSKVGAKPQKESGFKKVAHKIIMGSLLKLTDFDDFKAWWAKYTNGICFWSEKVDGLSVSLEYANGEFCQAVTRGDSITGEDVSANILKSDIPKKIKDKSRFTARGEIFIKKSVFSKNFKGAVSPRNAAVGLVKRLDSTDSLFLSVLVYDVFSDDIAFKTQNEKASFLKKMGFSLPESGIVSNPEDLLSIWEKYEKSLREESDYEMDGLVITANDLDFHAKLGYVNNRPKFARALKFTSQTAITTINSVEWQVGRTGRITPVAQVDPVLVAGAMISKISLHNLAEIRRLGIKLGQRIVIRRSGDVIPQIVSVINPDFGKEIIPPLKCPACGTKTVRSSKADQDEQLTNKYNSVQVNEQAIFLVCPNKECSAKHYETLLHWVSVLDIKGFGDELVQQLFDVGKVKEPADFYKLKIEDISSLERRGEKSATKVLEALHAKKEVTLPHFVKGLGIPGVGASITELAMGQFNTIQKLQKVKRVEELTSINGIGEITAQSLIDGLKDNSSIIKNLLAHVTIIKEVENKTGKLFSKTFCFTGFRNKDFEKQIVALGGKIVGSVTKDLSYLVTVDKGSSSSKIKKANSLGISVIEADELTKLF